MNLVIVESPYAGDVELHTSYARACMKDCLQRDEAPYASHLLYTQPGVLDDTDPEQRVLGMNAGFWWSNAADYVVVYTDLGVSKGMEKGIHQAKSKGLPVEYRTLPDWKNHVDHSER